MFSWQNLIADFQGIKNNLLFFIFLTFSLNFLGSMDSNRHGDTENKNKIFLFPVFYLWPCQGNLKKASSTRAICKKLASLLMTR
jgi:hypothetical protein